MGSKNRERMLLIAVAVCLGALGLDKLVITPLTTMWTTRSEKIVELKRSVEKGKQLIAREKRLNERWREMQDQSRTKDLSTTENELMRAVNSWAAASRLTVTSIKPRWIEEEKCRKLEVRASTTGTIDTITRFLYELECDTQPLKVEDVDISAPNDKNLTLNCEVRFTRLVLEGDKK